MRNSFLPLIPELDLAADLLAEAADLLLNGNINAAKARVVQADMPAICDYYYRIVGPIDPRVHWQSKMPSNKISKEEIVPMPKQHERQLIFCRDRWRCRFCQIRVISKEARDVFKKWLGARWGSEKKKECHCALITLSASLDHIIPRSRRGTNEQTNLVTACWPCQFGRNQWTLEEVGFNDPCERPPIVDEWDGLTRVIGYKKRVVK